MKAIAGALLAVVALELLVRARGVRGRQQAPERRGPAQPRRARGARREAGDRARARSLLAAVVFSAACCGAIAALARGEARDVPVALLVAVLGWLAAARLESRRPPTTRAGSSRA